MKILLAPSGYKESLDAVGVAHAMELGVRDVLPDADIVSLPLVDGGEGFTTGLVDVTGGSLSPLMVTGPVGKPVSASVGLLGGDGPRTAVVELAAAAGLRLVPRSRRDPLTTTSRGVGELIAAALDLRPERLLIGCGDSGINDGGAGLAQALGVRLLDREGLDLGAGGGELARLASIDTSGLDPRLADVEVVAACNPHNVLCGERGVARVFGPQKGATPEQVEMLSDAMDTYAAVVHRHTGRDVGLVPGSGASGGVGTALMVFCGATLTPRFDVVFEYLDIESALDASHSSSRGRAAWTVRPPRARSLPRSPTGPPAAGSPPSPSPGRSAPVSRRTSRPASMHGSARWTARWTSPPRSTTVPTSCAGPPPRHSA